MDVKMNFGEAVKHLDLEADTFFIVHFDSKDPDDMTTVAQGDVAKLSVAVGFATGQLNEDALMEMAKYELDDEEIKDGLIKEGIQNWVQKMGNKYGH